MENNDDNDFLNPQQAENLQDESYEKEAIYKFDGTGFVKLDINKSVIKVVITAEADEALKKIRGEVSAKMATRPDLSIIASALLINALTLEGLVDIVKAYGVKLYQS